jgi:hypothetical protein
MMNRTTMKIASIAIVIPRSRPRLEDTPAPRGMDDFDMRVTPELKVYALAVAEAIRGHHELVLNPQ